MTALPPDLVADLFRHRYGRMVAGLCRVLGPGRLHLVEDVVQEAMLRALRRWPAEGVPEQPEAWVFRVARNLALDSLRRQKIAAKVDAELQSWAGEAAVTDDPSNAAEPRIADDTLRMLFLCSHPAVPIDARVPLLLKTVCGFGVPAIARALLQKDATIAQRIVRAKTKLQADDVRFEVPGATALPERLGLVLQVIYLVFNEGYRSHAGADLVRPELVDEAIRLCALVLELPDPSPQAHALMALMLFLGARSPARCDENGDLVPLAAQDRSRWNRVWIEHGFRAFRDSIGGSTITAFHVEAAIASLHAAAPSYAATNWQRILQEYDRLLALLPSPVVRLNRAVAVGKVHGPHAGLLALAGLDDEAALDEYFLLGAVKAQLHWELGELPAAIAALERALTQPCTEPERRLLERRLAACRRGDAPAPW